MIFPDSLKVNSDVQEAIIVLDITMYRENADQIRADHDRRGIPHDSIDEIIRLDEEWRKAQYDADQIRERGMRLRKVLQRRRNLGIHPELKRFSQKSLI